MAFASHPPGRDLLYEALRRHVAAQGWDMRMMAHPETLDRHIQLRRNTMSLNGPRRDVVHVTITPIMTVEEAVKLVLVTLKMQG